MATAYAYFILMPATLVVLVSVNSVNLRHYAATVCLLAMTRPNTLNIAVNHRLISWGTTFRCCHMCSLNSNTFETNKK